MDQIKANPIQKENIKESDANTNQQQVIQQQREQEFNPQQSGQMHLQNKKLYKPNFIFCEDNNNMEKLLKTYPHLKTLKEAEDQDFEKIEDAKAYIIRSNTDDDIHKAIKYGVWCSTPPNNEMLDKAFEEAEEKNIPIYLFFSVVKSGQFVGIAKLKSGLQDKNFAFWWQHSKWRGCFDVEWVFVKDIVYKQFENLVNKEDKPVNRSKDGTEIDWKSTGLPMIQKYKEDKSSKSIFNQFQIFDQREQFQRWRYDPKNQFPQMQHQQQMQQFQQQQNVYLNYYQMLANQQLQQMKIGNQVYPPQIQNSYQQGGQAKHFYPRNNYYNQQYYGHNGGQQGGYKKPYNKKYNNNNRRGYNNYHNNNNQNRQYQQGRPQQQYQQPHGQQQDNQQQEQQQQPQQNQE